MPIDKSVATTGAAPLTAEPAALSSGPQTAALDLQGSAALDRMASTPPPQYYTVVAGDSLNKIAETVLHDGGAWLTLWNKNRAHVPDANHLRVGTKLLLPTQEELTAGGSPATATTTPPEPTSTTIDSGDLAASGTKLGEAEALFLRHGDLIRERAAALGIEPAVAAAIVLVESGGGGFQGERLTIRFEPAVFRRLTGKRVHNTHKTQDVEYAAFAAAKRIDEDAAYKSISMGAGQVMGFNAGSIGYTDASAMMKAFQASEEAQLRGMLDFIGNNAHLVKAAKAHQWTAFARTYNGPKQHGYDAKLRAAFAIATTAGERVPEGSVESDSGAAT